jgi:hypothetical protein
MEAVNLIANDGDALDEILRPSAHDDHAPDNREGRFSLSHALAAKMGAETHTRGEARTRDGLSMIARVPKMRNSSTQNNLEPTPCCSGMVQISKTYYD